MTMQLFDTPTAKTADDCACKSGGYCDVAHEPSECSCARCSEYHDKREGRIDRMRERADKKRDEREGRHKTVDRLCEVMNGQPVLVGHHSEKRHRKDLDRMSSNMRKCHELHTDATELDRRADAAESSTAINSDDPAALVLLREKVAAMKAEADYNATIHKCFHRKTRASKRTDADNERARTELEALNLKPRTIEALMDKGDFGDRVGIAPYIMTNLRANIRRVEKRLAALEAANAAGPRADVEVGDVRIAEEDNRVRIFFPGKPSADVRTYLKRSGFRWSPRAGAWQRKPSAYAWQCAKEAAQKASDES